MSTNVSRERVDSVAIEQALRCLRSVGYVIPDQDNIQDQDNTQVNTEYEQALSHRGLTVLDDLIPLNALRDDVRARHPDMPVTPVIQPDRPQSLGLGQYVSINTNIKTNLPLSPAINSYLELHSRVLDGTGHLGRSRETKFTKGQYPKLPSLTPARYLPADAATLYQTPSLPESWYQLCGNQSQPFPGSFSMTHKEMEESITNAGRDLSVVSDLDWMVSGASHLLKEMATTSGLQTSQTQIAHLQRYMLEVCRGLEVLELSNTARYANLIWHMRDSYLGKLHSSVPKSTRESLRRSPLNSGRLFSEETVALASSTLKSDVIMMANQKTLQRLNAPGNQSRGKRPSTTPYRQPGFKKPRSDFQPRVTNPTGATRGWNPPNRGGNQQSHKKAGRGRGRGKPK